MVKYKCFKVECPACGNSGSLQLFINKQGEVKYARVRHRIHENEEGFNPNIKYNFTYCKIPGSKQLETLLNSVNIQYPKPKLETPSLGQNGQLGQEVELKTHDPQLRSSSFICQNKWAGSSARIEHHPPKVGVVGSNPTPPVGDTPRTVLEIQVGCLRFLKIL
jgi:hypothetical protein